MAKRSSVEEKIAALSPQEREELLDRFREDEAVWVRECIDALDDEEWRELVDWFAARE
jgi:hypothetical protein